MLSDQKIALLIGISKTVDIFVVNRTRMAAPFNSNLGMRVAMQGATRFLAATMLVEIEPSLYLYLAYTTAPYASSDASTNVYNDTFSATFPFP